MAYLRVSCTGNRKMCNENAAQIISLHESKLLLSKMQTSVHLSRVTLSIKDLDLLLQLSVRIRD